MYTRGFEGKRAGAGVEKSRRMWKEEFVLLSRSSKREVCCDKFEERIQGFDDRKE
jgi:hypothetical protein